MLTLSQIREDLKEIRYYYSRKNQFDEASHQVGPNAVMEKVTKYNAIIRTASPMLYDLYVSLYLKNHTQESLSVVLNFTPQHIQFLNKQLLLFLQRELSK